MRLFAFVVATAVGVMVLLAPQAGQRTRTTLQGPSPLLHVAPPGRHRRGSRGSRRRSVAACLRSGSPCADADDCSISYGLSCLETTVPWGTPFAAVDCCFRCCVRHWATSLELPQRERFWRSRYLARLVDRHGIANTSLPSPIGCLDALAWSTDTVAASASHTFLRPGVAAEVSAAAADGGGGNERPCALRLVSSNGLPIPGLTAQLPPLLASAARRRERVVVWTQNDVPTPLLADEAELDTLDAQGVGAWWATGLRFPRHRSVAPFPLGAFHSARLREFLLQQPPSPPFWQRGTTATAMATAAAATDDDDDDDDDDDKASRALLFCSGFALHRQWPWSRVPSLQALLAAFPHCSPRRISKQRYMHGAAAARFVYSPRGQGPQDHREWEALALGAVPLTDHDGRLLGGLFDGLPIVRVDDWSRVTPAFLEAASRRLEAGVRAGNLSATKLYSMWWLAQLLRGSACDPATIVGRRP